MKKVAVLLYPQFSNYECSVARCWGFPLTRAGMAEQGRGARLLLEGANARERIRAPGHCVFVGVCRRLSSGQPADQVRLQLLKSAAGINFVKGLQQRGNRSVA